MPPIPPIHKPSTPSITVYIDINSPFCYFAFHVLTTNPQIFSTSTNPSKDSNLIHVTFLPCSVPHTIKVTGGLPPIKATPLKANYLAKDVRRQARRWGVEMLSEEQGFPEGFPLDRIFIQLQNLVYHVHKHYPLEKFLEVAKVLYHTIFTNKKPPSFPSGVEAVLDSIFSKKEIEEIINAVAKDDGEISAGLKAASVKAVEEQECFGLPWFVVTNKQGVTEMWWGSDQLDVISEFLDVSLPRRNIPAGK